ncbi:DUF2183 domain-containing protein [Arcanobacterium haemolyticum]|nr:DUF2183 domain-containing protein [Arcanobacterium haemolyticum]
MALADIARALENSLNKRGIVRQRERGWLPQILPYTGYGSTSRLHVLARAVMAPPNADEPFTFKFLPHADSAHPITRPVAQLLDMRGKAADAVDDFVEIAAETAGKAQRGWRQFFTTQVGNLPVTVRIAGQEIQTRTDSNGYIDVMVTDHNLTPGWHKAEIIPAAGKAVEAPIVVVDPQTQLGVVSDIDDTIVITWLPRMFIAAWNAFFLRTDARQPVPGMSEFFSDLLEGNPTAPVFYLSTGAWNTLPAMQAFIQGNRLPIGPLLMTDWGPTPTGLFRSGQEHKRMQLRNLIITFPGIKWVLVGDDGQHDPIIYDELAREHPSNVRAIALRQLNPVEQVLSNGMASTFEALHPMLPTRPESIPLIEGRDGFELLARLRGLKKRGKF